MAYYDQGTECSPMVAQGQAKLAAVGQYKPPTPRYKLEKQREELQAMLARVEGAIAILDANPAMEEFLEATQGLI